MAQIEEALEILEAQRASVTSRFLRTTLNASNHEYHEFYVDLLMRLHRQQPASGYDAKALWAAERVKARGLLDTLAETGAEIRTGVDPALLHAERRVAQQLDVKEQLRAQLVRGKPASEEFAELDREVASLRCAYESVGMQIRSSSSHYSVLTRPNSLTVREIAEQVLDGDSILLEYFLTEEASYLWAVTPCAESSFVLPGRPVIEQAVRDVYDLLTARNRHPEGESIQQRTLRIARADVAYTGAAAALSRMLLGPVAGELSRKRLLIVRDEVLQWLPFGALPIPDKPAPDQSRDSAGRKLHDFQPLLSEHEIVYLPSASVLAAHRHESRTSSSLRKTVAIFADPVFTRDDPRVGAGWGAGQGASATVKVPLPPTGALGSKRSAIDAGTDRFRRLRFTRHEAEAIVSLVAPEQRLIALDFAASQARLHAADLTEYRILHFATHGLLNGRHPELSGLVLSLVDEKGQPRAGIVGLEEISSLKINADLVVLSGCQTGLGAEVWGEGLVGPAHAFLYAGASRVAASLWSVEDKTTAELMKRFYQAILVNGSTPAAALRAAQESMRREKPWEAPYYWAAFTLQGEWR